MVEIIEKKDISNWVNDGDTIATVGMSLSGSSEKIYRALEERFLESGHPRDLTLVHAAGQSDRKDGILHFAHEGMVTRIIGSHWGLQPEWMKLISKNKVEAYCIPQGQVTHLYRSMARGMDGHLSRTGLLTFIDPRIEGGKMNERTRELPDIIEIKEIDGKEYIYYQEIPLDLVIIRGTYADEQGNLSCREEAMKIENLPAVLAAKRYGGKVLAQVKQVVEPGTLNPKEIVIPGTFIDGVVVSDKPEDDHRQTHSAVYDPALSGETRKSLGGMEPVPLNIRKLIGRRAIMEIEEDSVINLGTGIPNDTIGPIAQEERISEKFIITVESGIYNGVPMGGVDFGVGYNVDAMITHYEQFDFYNGAGVDYTFLGAGEMDAQGNVNSTKFGDQAPGAGGFIDITQGARNVVFCSKFTTGGLKIEFDENGLVIERDGDIIKMVEEVQQISFSSRYALENDQNMLFVTERAVFRLTEDGPELIEIAPGIDLEEDILEKMEFEPLIADDLREMDIRLFQKGKMGLANN